MRSAFGVIHKGLPASLKQVAKMPDSSGWNTPSSYSRRAAIKRRFGQTTNAPQTPQTQYVAARVESNVSGSRRSYVKRNGERVVGNRSHKTRMRQAYQQLEKPGKLTSQKAKDIKALRLKITEAKAERKRLIG
jgi:hypothetical protein